MTMIITLLSVLLPVVPALTAQEENPEQVVAAVEALRVRDVAWRGIPWKSCLLEGLAASRERKKPCVLWVFIDRPVDDARC